MHAPVAVVMEETDSELINLGFSQRCTFTGSGKTLTAIGLGVILHFHADYSALPGSPYFEKTLKGGVLKSYWDYYQEQWSRVDSFNLDEEFLKKLHELTLKLLTTNLREKSKFHLAEEIEECRDVQLGHKQFLLEICEDFKLYCVLIRGPVGQRVMELFRDTRRPGLVLPVVLQEEQERCVSLLCHKHQHSRPERHGFPYLMQSQDSLEWLANKFPGFAVLPIEHSEASEGAYELAKYNAVAALCDFVCEAFPQGVPSACMPPFREMCKVLDNFQSLHSLSMGRLAYAEDLQEVANLAARPHDALSCAAFPPDFRVLLSCGHAYHVPCLSAELQRQWATVGRTEKPVVFCPAHAVPVTDDVLRQVDPALLSRLQQARRDFRHSRVRMQS